MVAEDAAGAALVVAAGTVGVAGATGATGVAGTVDVAGAAVLWCCVGGCGYYGGCGGCGGCCGWLWMLRYCCAVVVFAGTTGVAVLSGVPGIFLGAS